MTEKLFRDIDRARAEAQDQYARGVTSLPSPLQSTGPAPHPAAARLGRLVLITLIVTAVISLVTGADLRLVVIAALLVPLLGRIGAHLGLLPRDLYRPNGRRQITMRSLFIVWLVATITWPVLLVASIPLVVILRRGAIHSLVLWAMKWQELRRLQSGRPPSPPLAPERP